MNAILAGMPVSGKSTAAQKLGKTLGVPFFDTDAEIERRHGKISKIFQTFGEEKFRFLETEVIKEICKKSGAIIAIGGGSLTVDENVKALKSSGKIIYLKANVETLLSRLGGDNSRPLLSGDARQNLLNLYKNRVAQFERYADFTVATDGLSADEVAQKIKETIIKYDILNSGNRV